jgi:hypothetical protein
MSDRRPGPRLLGRRIGTIEDRSSNAVDEKFKTLGVIYKLGREIYDTGATFEQLLVDRCVLSLRIPNSDMYHRRI